jgi:hypothetical protein
MITAKKPDEKSLKVVENKVYQPPSSINAGQSVLSSNLKNPPGVGINNNAAEQEIHPQGQPQGQPQKQKIRWIQMVPVPGICMSSSFRIGFQKISIWLVNIGMIMTVQSIIFSVYFARSGDEVSEYKYIQENIFQ